MKYREREGRHANESEVQNSAFVLSRDPPENKDHHHQCDDNNDNDNGNDNNSREDQDPYKNQQSA